MLDPIPAPTLTGAWSFFSSGDDKTPVQNLWTEDSSIVEGNGRDIVQKHHWALRILLARTLTFKQKNRKVYPGISGQPKKKYLMFLMLAFP